MTLAVVGCGHWGKNLVRMFSELGALHRICDTDEVALRTCARPGVRQSGRFEDVLDDDEVRAVAIATPAALHASMAREAIAAGKDVFVEKPLALRYREGRDVAHAAAASSVVLMVGHLLEYHPAVVRLQEIVRDGELGSVRYLFSNRLNLGIVRQEENILWSFAPHDISVISTLAGAEPAEVSTSGGSYLQDGIADVTVTNLAFPGGVRAHIFVSWLHPYKEQKLVVIGDRKMAVFDGVAGRLTIHDKGIDWKDGLPVRRETAETTVECDESEPLLLECRHFLDCVSTRATPKTGSANALAVLEVLEASQMSLERGGAPVALAEVEATLPA